MVTGSASMLAESAHSWADTGNQILLFIGDMRGRRPADESHPLGYALQRMAVERLRELPGVSRVAFLRMEFVGPRQTFLVASVDLDDDPPESSVAYRLRELEEELETESFVREAVLTLATPEEPSL